MNNDMTTPPIKFRGFRTDNGEPVYGSLVQFTESILSIFVLKNGGHDVFQIHPSSLGMFTGLTDKNGKEIYGAIGEKGGDVVSHLHSVGICVVVFQTSTAMFLAQEIGDEEMGFGVEDVIEIIGNQWEVDNGK